MLQKNKLLQSEFNISYQNWTALKSLVLAYFIAKMAPKAMMTLHNELSPAEWILQVDGSSNVKGNEM